MFRTVPLSIIRSFSLYTQQWYMSYRFADSLRAGLGRKFRPDPARKRFQQHRDASCHQVLFSLQNKAPKKIHAILTETLDFSFLVGLRTYQHPCNFTVDDPHS